LEHVEVPVKNSTARTLVGWTKNMQVNTLAGANLEFAHKVEREKLSTI
jgi:hypothetical protein